MRITQSQLIELARAEVQRQAASDGVTAAFLIGSIVHDQAVLGGAADIDLVLIHESPPYEERQIIGLSDDVHLDIAHHARDRYAQPRLLRLDPWLGPAIYDPLPLFDPEHFFEWAQAAARGQFLRADHRLGRAQAFLTRAREAKTGLDAERPWVSPYLRSALSGANAIASLSGQPAAGRRVLAQLRTATMESGYPGVHHELRRLIGVDRCGPQQLASWVSQWARAFDAGGEVTGQPDLLPERREYYLKGFQALLETDDPHGVLWTLLDSWDRVMHNLAAYSADEDHRPAWDDAVAILGLTSDEFGRRSEELEIYLDQIEASLEEWAARSGAL
jgi:hypothetical protein